MQYFVSRHAGAHEWAARQGFDVTVISHFDTSTVVDGDVVIGTLPIHLAAEVCAKNARYFHLILDLAASDRGQEISADRMEALGARIAEYKVKCLS